MPRCPSCNTLMTRSTQDNLRLHTCSNCFGHWIAYPALLRLVRNPAPATPVTPGESPGPTTPTDPTSTDPAIPAPAADPAEPSLQELAAIVVESNTTKTLRCPECHVDLRKDRLHPMVPVQIDRCPRCQYIWLDVGELPLLKRLYAELQTSTDPRVSQLREKVAQVSAQWEGRTRAVDEVDAALHTTADHTNDLTSFLRLLTGL